MAEFSAESSAQQGRGAGHGLIALGVVCGLGGVALAGLPGRIPGLTHGLQAMVDRGVSPGLVFGVGVILSAVGLAVRRLATEVRAGSTAIERIPSPAAEIAQLGSELAQVRGALQALRVDSVYLKDAVATLQQSRGEDFSAEQLRGMQASIFQLATSMDQMGGRLDERLSMQNDVFTQALQRLHDSLLTTSVRIDELHGRMAGISMAGSQASLAHRPDSLGVLDWIQDEHVPRTPTTVSIPLSAAPAELPRGPLPGPVVADAAMANTIAHLRSLFADERVQRALEHMQRADAL